MFARLLMAIALALAATPALARERIEVRARVDALALLLADEALSEGVAGRIDALALLMADDRVRPQPARVAALPIGFDLRGARDTPLPTDLTGFERLDGGVPRGLALEPVAALFAAPRPEAITATFAARYAVGDGLASRPPPRRKTMWSGSVTLRLDGDEASPALTTGGAAALLNLIPR